MTAAERAQRRREMADRVTAGRTLASVAAEYGVSISTVATACRKCDVHVREMKRDKRSRLCRAIASAVESGEPVSRVATLCGVSQSTVYVVLRAMGVERRRDQTVGGVDVLCVVWRLMQGESQSAIAADLGLSRQRINQIAARAEAAGFCLPSVRPAGETRVA